jgi:hypothetical protein
MAADVVTRLIARYVCMAELRSLLETNFSGAYTVKVSPRNVDLGSSSTACRLPSSGSDHHLLDWWGIY